MARLRLPTLLTLDTLSLMTRKHQPSYSKRYNPGTCLGYDREPHDATDRRRGLCHNCYQRASRAGVLDSVALPPKHQRDRTQPHSRPVGSKRIAPSNGYVELKVGEKLGNRGRNNWVYEHVWVMEQHLGRKLLPGEEVHHRNRQRDDNRLENLELWVTSQPAGGRVEDLIDWLVTHHREAVLEALKNAS